MVNSQIAGASRYTATLLETVCGVAVLALTEHEVLVDILAVLANEETRGLEWRGSDTQLIYVWLARRHGSRLDVGLPWELGISMCGHSGLKRLACGKD